MIDWRFATSHASRRFLPALIVALVGAGLECLQWVGARPLWLDEEMIALNVRDRGLLDLTGRLWLNQSAPFGWLALQRVTLLLFGPGERAMRLVPTLFGIATLAAAVWIGRRWMRPLGAVLLVLLCAFGQWISFYVLELKQYSADIFFSLFLPALVVWAAEAPDAAPGPGRGGAFAAYRRVTVWWVAAAIAQWFANGAILVTPSCAVTLFIVAWRRDGWRAATRTAAPALLWVASFGVHYISTLRYTIGNDALQEYWSFALPPASAGFGGTIAWLSSQLAPFTAKPGGTPVWVAFWIAVAAGIVLLMRTRLALALVIALIPVSAFAMAGMRIAPLHERLSLWVVPALYIGIAASADEAAALIQTAWAQRRWLTVSLAALIATVALRVCFDLAVRGVADIREGRPRSSNHDLNDRAALGWLTSQRQPNDSLVTTHLGLPAAWWYGRVPISGPYLGGGYPADGAPIIEVLDLSTALVCGASALREAVGTSPRVLVYFGFRFDDVPKNFDERTMDVLRELGSIVADRRFEGASRAAIVDLRLPPDKPGGHDSPDGGVEQRSGGCVAVQLAQRW
jgi:hypothetical protein